MKTRILCILSAAVSLVGCFRKVATDTDFVLKPLVQRVSGDQLLPVEGATAFAYAVDTTEWTVASYDDALAGVITLRSDPSQRRTEPYAVAEPYLPADGGEGMEGRIHMRLRRASQMVVAVDPADRLYAYTQQAAGENLPATYATLIFKPYREGLSYKEGAWVFRNDFYEPPVWLDCTLSPRRQAEEGGEVSDYEVSTSAIKAYAFAADTALWYIADYTDALNGVITSKFDDGQRRESPNFSAYVESGAYRMRVSDPMLMVVVVDRNSSMYAYSKQTVSLDGDPVDFSVVFRPWRQTLLYVEEGWRVVDDTFREKDPDENETTSTPRSR